MSKSNFRSQFLHRLMGCFLIALILCAWQPSFASPLRQSVDITKFVELERIGRGTITQIALSPDGETLAVATSIGIWLYDMATLESVRFMEGHTDELLSVTWSPDGSMIASGSADMTIRLWDVRQGTELAVLEGHTDAVTSVAWSPDGKMLASGSADMTVRLWDTEPHTETAILEGHTAQVNSVAWSPDSTRVASAGDITVRVWDVANEAEIFTFEDEHDFGVLVELVGAVWSPDGTEIAATAKTDADMDGWLMFWDAMTGESAGANHTPLTDVNTIAWQPNGRKLALGGAMYFMGLYGIKIIDRDHIEDAGFIEGVFNVEEVTILSIIWTPDGNRLIALEPNSIVRIWNPELYEPVGIIQHDVAMLPDWVQFCSRSYRGVTYSASPDGQYRTMPTERDGSVTIEEVSSGNIVQYIDFQLRGTSTPYLAWSPDNRHLAIEVNDHSIAILDRENWQPVFTLDLAEAYLLQMDWSPDSQLLVINSIDHTSTSQNLYVWSIESNEEVTIWESQETRVDLIRWSPDGSYFTFSTIIKDTNTQNIHLWDVGRKEEQSIFEAEQISGFQWLCDSDVLTIASAGTVTLVDVNNIDHTEGTAPLVTTLDTRLDWVGGIGWSADGTRLAFYAGDGTIRIWGEP